MWFVLILESQDGKSGRQEEMQHGVCTPTASAGNAFRVC